MSKKIELNARSNEFEKFVLIWESQVDLFTKTQFQTFTYQVQEGSVVEYTVQSILQAFLLGNYKTSNRVKDHKAFRMVYKENLVCV